MKGFLERVAERRQAEQMAEARGQMPERKCACGGTIRRGQPLNVSECFDCRRAEYRRKYDREHPRRHRRAS